MYLFLLRLTEIMILVVGFLIIAGTVAAENASPTPPNIVFIVADDLVSSIITVSLLPCFLIFLMVIIIMISIIIKEFNLQELAMYNQLI